MDLGHIALWIASRPPVVARVTRVARASAISQGDRSRPAMAPTFDDGPHPRWTSAILDVLDRYAAKATFFVVGRCVAEHPEIVRETRRRGHDIGTHLYSHHRAAVGDDRKFDDELRRSCGQLEGLLGEPGA